MYRKGPGKVFLPWRALWGLLLVDLGHLEIIENLEELESLEILEGLERLGNLEGLEDL